MASSTPRVGRFVYGINVYGLDDVVELDASVVGADSIAVRVTTADVPHVPLHRLDADRSVEVMGAAHQWVLERAGGTAHLVGPQLDSDLLAHPCLAPAAIAFNRWAGRESFHAASFAAGGQAYGVVGPRTAGKSTLMAGLAHAGMTVLSDDIVITDGVDAFAGPRCIDLRTQLPGRYLAVASARLGTRFRLRLPSAPAQLPLGGWIFLRWGPTVSMQPRSPAVVLSRLAAWRGRRGLATEPSVLLDLASKPAWDLVRPLGWSTFDRTIETLTRTLSDSPAMSA